MRLTRKHLNYILVNLPEPRLAHEGRIPPFFKVAVVEHNHLIQDALLPNYHPPLTKNLTFEYDDREMDWVLKDLDL